MSKILRFILLILSYDKSENARQKPHKLYQQTGLSITFAAENHRQGKTQDHKGRDIIYGLVDPFFAAFHNAEQYAEKGDKGDHHHRYENIENDTELIPYGTGSGLIPTDKNHAPNEKHKGDPHKDDHIIRFIPYPGEGKAVLYRLCISKIDHSEADRFQNLFLSCFLQGNAVFVVVIRDPRFHTCKAKGCVVVPIERIPHKVPRIHIFINTKGGLQFLILINDKGRLHIVGVIIQNLFVPVSLMLSMDGIGTGILAFQHPGKGVAFPFVFIGDKKKEIPPPKLPAW